MSAAALVRWLALGCAVALVGVGLDRVGLPSTTVLAGAAVGIAAARWSSWQMTVGARAARSSQAAIGVILGASLSATTLSELGSLWLPVVLLTVATALLGVGLGLLLRRLSGLDAGTAVLASVPGGAIGLVVMARELGADDRLVGFSQYLRVLVILLATPVLVATVFAGAGTTDAPPEVVAYGAGAAALAVLAGVVGAVLGRAIRLPAPSLLGPMLIAATLAIALPDIHVHVPGLVREAAFGLVGLDVGLRFTRDALHEARRLLPAFTLCVTLLLVVSFLLGALLAATTSVSLLDAYLATTPGGLTVVAATAYGAGADTALVTGVQMVRLIVMLVAAPALVRLTVRALGGPSSAASGRGGPAPRLP